MEDFKLENHIDNEVFIKEIQEDFENSNKILFRFNNIDMGNIIQRKKSIKPKIHKTGKNMSKPVEVTLESI